MLYINTHAKFLGTFLAEVNQHIMIMIAAQKPAVPTITLMFSMVRALVADGIGLIQRKKIL